MGSKIQKEIYSSASKINHISFDKNTNIIWASTNNGLIKISKPEMSITTLISPFATKSTINSIIEDNQKNIWITNNSNKILCFTNTKNWISFSNLDNKTHFNKLSIYKNKIIISANDGVYKIENNRLKKIISTKYSIRKAIEDHQNRLWVMTETNGTKVYDANTYKENKIIFKTILNIGKQTNFMI